MTNNEREREREIGVIKCHLKSSRLFIALIDSRLRINNFGLNASDCCDPIFSLINLVSVLVVCSLIFCSTSSKWKRKTASRNRERERKKRKVGDPRAIEVFPSIFILVHSIVNQVCYRKTEKTNRWRCVGWYIFISNTIYLSILSFFISFDRSLYFSECVRQKKIREKEISHSVPRSIVNLVCMCFFHCFVLKNRYIDEKKLQLNLIITLVIRWFLSFFLYICVACFSSHMLHSLVTPTHQQARFVVANYNFFSLSLLLLLLSLCFFRRLFFHAFFFSSSPSFFYP